MKIDKRVQKIDNDFLDSIKNHKILSITNAIQVDVLEQLISYDVIDDSIKLILDCDMNNSDYPNCICNLDILKFFSKIKKLDILCHSSSPLSDINNISYLKCLHSFSLSGYLKNIKLSPLRNFLGQVEYLDIDNMLIDKKYYDIINNNPLKELSLRKLDLALIEKNDALQKLVIYYELLNPELISEKFPNLTELKLINCSKISDFSFLRKLSNIEIMTFNGVKGMTIFPIIKNNSLKSLSILHGKNFLGFESPKNLEHLQYLGLTFTKMTVIDIEFVFQNTLLNQFHFISEKEKTEKEVTDLSKKYGVPLQ